MHGLRTREHDRHDELHANRDLLGRRHLRGDKRVRRGGDDPGSPSAFHRDCLDDLAALARDEVPDGWETRVGTDREVTFLSPLDNLLARDRTVDLFGFEVIWEIYKPAEKRSFGYYTMPILYGDQLVGRIDPKLDRKARTLRVLGLWFEEDAPLGADLLDALGRGLVRFVRFLDAGTIDLSGVDDAAVRGHLEAFTRR